MIRWGELKGGLKRNPKGSALPVFTGQIQLEDSEGPQAEHREAYLKALGWRGLASELLAALVGQELGLPVPGFALVWVPDNQFPGGVPPEVTDLILLDGDGVSHVLMFASLNEMGNGIHPVEAPGSQDWSDRVCKWPGLPLTVAFDALIANEDRHRDNILVDDDRVWLIDHSHAFGMIVENEQVPAADCAHESQIVRELTGLLQAILVPFSAATLQCVEGIVTGSAPEYFSPVVRAVFQEIAELLAPGCADLLRRQLGTYLQQRPEYLGAVVSASLGASPGASPGASFGPGPVVS